MNYDLVPLWIAAIGGFLGGVGAFFNGLTTYRVATRVSVLTDHVSEVKTGVAVVAADVNAVRIQSNGVNAALVKLTGEAEHARGMLDQAASTAAK